MCTSHRQKFACGHVHIRKSPCANYRDPRESPKPGAKRRAGSCSGGTEDTSEHRVPTFENKCHICIDGVGGVREEEFEMQVRETWQERVMERVKGRLEDLGGKFTVERTENVLVAAPAASKEKRCCGVM